MARSSAVAARAPPGLRRLAGENEHVREGDADRLGALAGVDQLHTGDVVEQAFERPSASARTGRAPIP